MDLLLQLVPVGTGLEWMPIASFAVPLILLLILVFVGAKRTV